MQFLSHNSILSIALTLILSLCNLPPITVDFQTEEQSIQGRNNLTLGEEQTSAIPCYKASRIELSSVTF